MFKNPNDPENHIIRNKIKEWLQQYHRIDPAMVLSIDEIPCRDPGCPDIFTKIVCMYNSTKSEFIVHKPLIFIRQIDVKGLNIS